MNDLERVTGPPFEGLIAVDQRFKYSAGRSGDLNFRNHRILIGCDCRLGHCKLRPAAVGLEPSGHVGRGQLAGSYQGIALAMPYPPILIGPFRG
jgi:hypothetical protein